MSSRAAARPSLSDLDAARGRDEGAFERLVAAHRAGLQAHCYRMLGSAADAEDALQETLLRAWRGLPGFEGRSSLRSWLYRIATNVCLKMIERRPKRVLPVDYGPARDPYEVPDEPLVESVWIEPYPDADLPDSADAASPEARYEQRESVELAFVAALQHLPERQRAVLLLRDVLGFSPGEIAAALDASPAAVYSSLQRAHRAVEERLPARTQQATLRSIGDERLRELVERYVRAWEEADVEAIKTMLTDDATFAMPPSPSWFRGRDQIAAFLAARPLYSTFCAPVSTSAGRRRWLAVPVAANGQLAFAFYGSHDDGRTYGAHVIQLLTLDGDAQIAEVMSFQAPESFARFGLANTIRP
jgi:RNA polymerase sigma-70 factor (ECF subfamily)